MEKNNMTAVEWLQNALPSLFEHDDDDFYKGIFQQAKQMEKEQIMKAHNDGFLVYGSEYRTAEQYYGGTYGRPIHDSENNQSI